MKLTVTKTTQWYFEKTLRFKKCWEQWPLSWGPKTSAVGWWHPNMRPVNFMSSSSMLVSWCRTQAFFVPIFWLLTIQGHTFHTVIRKWKCIDSWYWMILLCSSMKYVFWRFRSLFKKNVHLSSHGSILDGTKMRKTRQQSQPVLGAFQSQMRRGLRGGVVAILHHHGVFRKPKGRPSSNGLST